MSSGGGWSFRKQATSHDSPRARKLQKDEFCCRKPEWSPEERRIFLRRKCTLLHENAVFEGAHCRKPQEVEGGFSRGQKINANFFCTKFSRTLRVMDVCSWTSAPKSAFFCGPVMGRNFLTPGHPGVRVRSVRGKSGPKSLCLLGRSQSEATQGTGYERTS